MVGVVWSVGESPDEERPKPGRYGEYGDEVPQWVHDVLEKASDAGVWLESELWEDVAPYKYANHTLRVPEACKVGHRHAFFVPMAIQDHGVGFQATGHSLCMDHRHNSTGHDYTGHSDIGHSAI